ncbi:uncharacterized protein LOC115729355 [Rhodamnia argentea]|uniref:ADP-ribosyl cyclase/cyclic ADP-ribose hydrolase n=1 Tax=Rhodamnia argentea TaxID=178133 RepID=A0ABM3HW40_9MYRT|nr:uncharacterized protein LOC115729355 [Rhodamnia argentea]
MNVLAIILLAHLCVYTCRFMQKKRRAVPRNYDVFLSFKGGDTRTGFTDFLYNSLLAAGFHVFRDDDALPVGDKIGPGIFQAIRKCRVAIPIISEQYVHSHWCVRELAEIMDCHERHRKPVFPIFYKVDVVDVLRERRKFKEALHKHERKWGPKVPKWQKALISVARIKGWRSKAIANGHEGELVKMVVARVSSELQTMWIERLPMFPILMSSYPIRSVSLYFSEKKRRESEWQVFLAFHGPDTRCGFAAFLYISLVAAGIRVFSNNDPSLIGTDLSRETRNAIGVCKISIPILSKNFASSRWRLKELAQMVETKGQKILPIFYKVKPSHVRKVSHRFGREMLQHKELVDLDTYGRWERALKEVGSFKGWESERIANGHEAVLVKQVVKEVSRLLNNPRTHDPLSPIPTD